mmetsp:Transcript_9276/g.21035  ORF Transcript_9276/g.21035 Transcript_9276/m.21035 type:complete len:218 (-) Transcript_9276:13-666(-)
MRSGSSEASRAKSEGCTPCSRWAYVLRAWNSRDDRGRSTLPSPSPLFSSSSPSPARLPAGSRPIGPSASSSSCNLPAIRTCSAPNAPRPSSTPSSGAESANRRPARAASSTSLSSPSSLRRRRSSAEISARVSDVHFPVTASRTYDGGDGREDSSERKMDAASSSSAPLPVPPPFFDERRRRAADRGRAGALVREISRPVLLPRARSIFFLWWMIGR